MRKWFYSQMMLLLSLPAKRSLAYIKKIKKLFSDLHSYLNMNKLVPNSRKSKLMMFRSRPTQDLPSITFGGEEIEWITEFKYLGITISNNLSFSRHINNISLNVSRMTGSFTCLLDLDDKSGPNVSLFSGCCGR